MGEKTIGVAVCDETETFAFPGETILRQEGYKRDMAAVRQLVETKSIEEIVVGLPLSMSGERGTQAEKVEQFVETLKRYVSIPISLQDERLSTSEAERVLIAADQRRNQRKKVIDSVAASVILQRFMDLRRYQREAS